MVMRGRRSVSGITNSLGVRFASITDSGVLSEFMDFMCGLLKLSR